MIVSSDVVTLLVKKFENRLSDDTVKISIAGSRAVKNMYRASKMSKSQVKSFIPEMEVVKRFTSGQGTASELAVTADDGFLALMFAANFTEEYYDKLIEFSEINISRELSDMNFDDVKIRAMVLASMTNGSRYFNVARNVAFAPIMSGGSKIFYTKEMKSMLESDKYKVKAYDAYMAMKYDPGEESRAIKRFEKVVFNYMVKEDLTRNDNGSLGSEDFIDSSGFVLDSDCNIIYVGDVSKECNNDMSLKIGSIIEVDADGVPAALMSKEAIARRKIREERERDK